MSFAIAASVDDALRALADGARPVAGGSDLVVGARHGKVPLPPQIIAIDRLDELAHVTVQGDELTIGALVTHAALMQSSSVIEHATGVADAAALVGSPATRNVGTLGGNIMNASPAMDTGAPLVVLGAQVELASVGGRRTVDVAELWDGPGSNTASTDELCTAVQIPIRARSGSAYVRLEYRRAMEIAVVGAAARLDLNDDGTVADAALALTAVAPTILPVPNIAEIVRGAELRSEQLDAVAAAAEQAATPISDLRAGADYRRHTVAVMARRALDAAHRRAAGEQIDVPVNRAEGIGR